LQAQGLGYPEEFNEWVFGRSVYANEKTQVTNATAAQMIFYDYDFVGDTAELNLRGRDKLAAIGPQLASNFFPLVIERTPRVPGLDEARRVAVFNRLAGGPFRIPAERVVIGPPIAFGRMGIEAILVDRNRAGSVASGGALGGIAGGAGTSVGALPLDASGMTGSVVGPGIR
jgi:hypothetical protein